MRAPAPGLRESHLCDPMQEPDGGIAARADGHEHATAAIEKAAHDHAVMERAGSGHGAATAVTLACRWRKWCATCATASSSQSSLRSEGGGIGRDRGRCPRHCLGRHRSTGATADSSGDADRRQPPDRRTDCFGIEKVIADVLPGDKAGAVKVNRSGFLAGSAEPGRAQIVPRQESNLRTRFRKRRGGA